MKKDINSILQIYLGTDQNGGYQPIGKDDRLKVAHPEQYDKVREIIKPYLDFEFTPNWEKQTLNQAGDAFIKEILIIYPELTNLTARSLSNRFTYNWR